MKTFKTPKSVIAIVNAKLCYSVFLGVVSYAIFPTSMKWYGFGLLSIFVGAAAIGLAINAFRQIAEIREFENEQDMFIEGGNEVKSSSLLAEDFMTEKGVIKDAE